MKLKRAWIIRWDYFMNATSDMASKNEVVSILPFSWGHKRIVDVLERLYKERALTLREKAYWRNSNSGPYKVQNMAFAHGVPVIDFYYSIGGHGPALVAHQAQDIEIKGQNTISWVEPAVKHYSWNCKYSGHEDCPLADKPPHLAAYSYKKL